MPLFAPASPLAVSLIVLLVTTAGVLACLLVRLHRTPAQSDEPDLPVLTEANDAGADERWSAFLIGMSHELRTPMNAVIGFTEMLLDADLPDTQHQQIRLIADSGRAMLRLLNDVLDVARIKAGQLRLVEEEADLGEELDHAIALMQPIAAAKGLVLSLDVAADIPPKLLFDRLRLRQVVLNLIGNALKFSESGSVTVTLWRQPSGVTIIVRDTGRGMAADRLPSLFTPFAPESATNDRQFGGTGLGLPICDHLVRLMGGAIAVESTLGTGSTFTVSLPLPEVRAMPPSASAPEKHAPSSASSLRGYRVLVAEDHPINQHLILAMAETLGLDAVLAVNGREAVDMALRASEGGEPFKLVLMDVQMPVMDGLAAARALRAAGLGPRDLPIIALTANCYADDIAAALAAGMQAHLAKPLMLADLERALRQHLRAEAPDTPAPHGCDMLRQPEGMNAAIHSLDHRYRQRKQDLLRQVSTILAERDRSADWDAMASAFHRLAGVAANFSDAELGDLAQTVERELKSAEDGPARYAILARHFPALHAAA